VQEVNKVPKVLQCRRFRRFIGVLGLVHHRRDGADVAVGGLGGDGQGVGPVDQRDVVKGKGVGAVAVGGELDPVVEHHADLVRR